jgi:transmembrane sensor
MHEQQRQRPDPAREARDWIVRLNSGDVTDAELEAFRHWHGRPENVEAFGRESTFWRDLQTVDRSSSKNVQLQGRRRISRRTIVAGGLAAGIGGAAVGLRLDLIWRADHRTAPGERRNVALPDGTPMLMNTDTVVALDFENGARRVALLRGEAQFEATGGVVPLEVAAAGALAVAQAASFAIRALDDSARVTVAAGEVTVGSGSDLAGSGAIVAAGEQGMIDHRGRFLTTAVDIERALAWRDGRIVLDGARFADAVSEIGRYLPERVMVTDSRHDSAPVSGVFSTTQPIEALEAVVAVQGMSMRRVPGFLILIS